MIRVALIVALSSGIRIVEQSDRAQLITDGYDRSPDYLAYLRYLIALRVPVVNALQLRVAAESLTEPFQLEVDGIRVNDSLRLYFEEQDLA